MSFGETKDKNFAFCASYQDCSNVVVLGRIMRKHPYGDRAHCLLCMMSTSFVFLSLTGDCTYKKLNHVSHAYILALSFHCLNVS